MKRQETAPVLRSFLAVLVGVTLMIAATWTGSDLITLVACALTLAGLAGLIDE